MPSLTTLTRSKASTFSVDRFQATKWSSAEDKAKFVQDLVVFVESGFKRAKFTKALYARLSMTFGHIAHYTRDGFYQTRFATAADQRRWLQHVGNYGSCGDPQWTFVDAEQAFQSWLKAK